MEKEEKKGEQEKEEKEEIPNYEETIKKFKEGDIIPGKIVKIDKDEVLVDVGYKSEGVIPPKELSVKYNIKPEEIVKVGDFIDAVVLEKEDADGRLILSAKRAKFKKTWQKIEETKEEDGVVMGKVIEVVKGGLIIDIGVRGFIPASLVDLQKPKDLQKYIGQELECKIVDLNRHRNNVVLSRRAFLEDRDKEKRASFLEKLKEGQVITGTISNIAKFGAFVDLDGIVGLIHLSELSWEKVTDASKIVSIDDKVKVKVLDIDMERGRVSLSLKQTLSDPWRESVRKYKVGQVVEATISKIVSFGAFAKISSDLEGLIHLSELADYPVGLPNEVVEIGDKINVKIIDIDEERHRLSLSIKQSRLVEEKKETEVKEVEEKEVKVEEVVKEEEVPKKPRKKVVLEEILKPEEILGDFVEKEEKPLEDQRPKTKDQSEEAAKEAEAVVIPAEEEKPVEEEAVATTSEEKPVEEEKPQEEQKPKAKGKTPETEKKEEKPTKAKTEKPEESSEEEKPEKDQRPKTEDQNQEIKEAEESSEVETEEKKSED